MGADESAIRRVMMLMGFMNVTPGEFLSAKTGEGLMPGLALRRPQAVETTGIIRPLGIGKGGRAAGEGVRGYRRPDWIDQVCGSFHNDCQVRIPRDDEPEPVRPNAKSWARWLHQRGQRHVGQTDARFESIIPDAGEAVWDRDVGQEGEK